jgi:dihydroxyacid dehydratase/phosphogluconate dehydratase
MRTATVAWVPRSLQATETVLAPSKQPFQPNGGLKMLTGNIGRR